MPPEDAELPRAATLAAPAPSDASPADRVAGRYALGKRLGKGGFGAVYRAHDTLTDADVALKVLHRRSDDEAERFRAEVSLLRLLRLPGLVHLLDDGVHEGRPFLVTELVDGNPFPGVPAPATWAEVERPAVRLLEAVARVHAYGVVHRDLKPANVLVLPDGQPVILDFGVSFGPGFTEDGEALSVGTPAFLAPEQAMGRRGDPRADLYAIGVMLYEALTGRLPHDERGISGLLRAKLTREPDPILTLVPDLPTHVAVTIDAMLRLHPEARPASASAVLRQLGVRPEVEHLPRLGGDAPVQAALQALRAGRTVRTHGRPGLGHSRLVQDVAAALAAEGRTAWCTRPSRHRWGSLPPEVRGQLARITEARPETVVELLRSAPGAVVLVDDAPRVDADTRDAIVRSGVPALWVGTAGEGERVELEPLARDDLRALFHGPDLVFHLREDASRLAHQRTGGEPKKLVRLLDAWVKAGLCFWEDGRLRIGRESIDRLEAGLRVVLEPDELPASGADAEVLSWVSLAGTTASREVLGKVLERDVASLELHIDAMIAEGRIEEDSQGTLHALETLPLSVLGDAPERRDAHRAVASAAAPGTPGRLLHLVQSGDAEHIVEEAMAVVDRSSTTGRLGDAFAALREALAFVRHAGRAEDELVLLRALTLVGIEMQSARSVDLALYEVERGRRLGAAADRLAQLLDATRLVRYVERDRGRALETARALPSFGDDVALEKWRRAAEMVAGFGLSPAEHLAIAERHLEWAEGSGDAAVAGSVCGWVGVALYRLSRFDEAAEAHARAAELSGGAMGAANAWTNAAAALLESGRLDAAHGAARRARGVSDEIRFYTIGVRALYLERAALLRSGAKLGDIDGALFGVEECPPDSVAKLLEVEAVYAWRHGDRGRAAECAQRAAIGFASVRSSAACELMLALHSASVGEYDPAAKQRYQACKQLRALPRIRAQISALQLATLAGTDAGFWRVEGARSLGEIYEGAPAMFEVLSAEACRLAFTASEEPA